MSSAVDIVNQALLMLGSNQIISFDDETVEASAAKALYPTAKKQVLRSYPWRCATKTERLARSTDTPVDPNWQYFHAIPDDSLRVLEVVMLDELAAGVPEWTIEGPFVMANVTPIGARFIKNIPEPELDVHVEMALVGRVAMDLSYTLTASQSREASLYQLYETKLNEARVTDRQEASHKHFHITGLDVVRR